MEKLKNAFAKARSSESYWIARAKLSIATQLQDLVKKAGITQEKYAHDLGVKPSQVSRALNGMSNPTIETVVKMAFALGYVPTVTFVPNAARQEQAHDQIAFDQAEICLDVQLTEIKPIAKLYNFEAARAAAIRPSTFTPTSKRDGQFAAAA